MGGKTLLPPEASTRAWCRRRLNSDAIAVLFRVRHISEVTGLRLADGREVVLKARAPAARIAACFQVQHRLWRAGYPCPEPLAGPAPLGERMATAERFRPGGTQLPRAAEAPHLFAEELARLVFLAPPLSTLPSLAPPPYWTVWDHEGDATWPADPDVDLNGAEGPRWLEAIAALARQRLLAAALPPVAGHLDWESQNLRWRGGRLHAAHDWDSIAARPEATIAGAAAIVFPASGTLNEQATIAQSERFLAAYQAARGRPFSAEEREVAWAAGLWVQAYKARKGVITGAGTRLLAPLAQERGERLRRAGIHRAP